MKISIRPSVINGTLMVPASKSAMQRACAAALVKGNKTILANPGVSEDDKSAMDIIRQLGAQVTSSPGKVVISSQGIQPLKATIHCGESGLSLRLFTSIAALSKNEIILTGSGSLLKRPVGFFDDVLPQLGVSCQSNNGLLPLIIKGPLTPADIEIDGSLSSQFLTGLLFAYAAAGANDVTIKVKALNSKPYIDLTLKIMAEFGLKVPFNDGYKSFYFPRNAVSQFPNHEIHYQVEGDWSNAAFLMVAAAIGGEIELKGLDVFSVQGDKLILQALMQSNALLSINQESISIKKNNLKAFHINATDTPDLFPPLAALACYCDGSSVIEGVSRLLHKESNRAVSLTEEFLKLGADIRIQDDLMIIKGSKLQTANLFSHNDHRIAMACAVAALGVEGSVTIDGTESVNKSYPGFWEDLQSVGGNLSLTNNS